MCTANATAAIVLNVSSIQEALYVDLPLLSPMSVANLLETRLPVVPVVAASTPYDGGVSPTFQNVTVVDALTVQALLSPISGLYTLDISQLLAAALFELGSFSGQPYPDMQQPYMYTASSALVDIDVTTQNILTTLDNIYSLLGTTLQAQVPTVISFTGGVLGTQTVGLSTMLADTLYLPSVNNINGANNASFVEYVPIARMMGIPYLDPYISPTSASCATTGSATAPEFPFGVMYGAPVLVDASIPNWSQSSTSRISGLQFESISRCYSETFGSSERDNRLAEFAPTSTIMALSSKAVT
jgi:hypothetical protein